MVITTLTVLLRSPVPMSKGSLLESSMGLLGKVLGSRTEIPTGTEPILSIMNEGARVSIAKDQVTDSLSLPLASTATTFQVKVPFSIGALGFRLN